MFAGARGGSLYLFCRLPGRRKLTVFKIYLKANHRFYLNIAFLYSLERNPQFLGTNCSLAKIILLHSETPSLSGQCLSHDLATGSSRQQRTYKSTCLVVLYFYGLDAKMIETIE